MKKIYNFRFLAAILAMLLVFGTVESHWRKRRKPVIRRKRRLSKNSGCQTGDYVYTVQSGTKHFAFG